MKVKNTFLSEIHVKKTRTPTDNLKVKPEYDDVKKLAKENNQPSYLVYNKINNNF
ncbi:MAG: DUF111 family protein [Maribacter sp.]|nr:DUF111 family protein [Maribacter sp.]